MENRGRAESGRTTVAEFLNALGAIGALSPRRLGAIRARVDSGALPPDPTVLARRLIGHGVVSEFQARYLLHGRATDLLVGRYVVADRIGRGSMGRVYRASDPLLGRDVALKIIDSPRSGGPGVAARFRREMRMAGRLDHPNIVRAYDADRVGDRLFIAMELIRGASLEEHLRSRGPLPPADVVRHAARAASGLAHAHGRGVVHRDVKPANILLNEAGDIKLLDFGLGVLAAADDPDGFATEAAMIVGTANFLSPEQACGRPVDGRSDLYSLGCTMYYLLCGELPFPGDSPMERIAARLVGTPVPISDLRPGLCPRVVGVINRLMARQPEDRFEDAAEAEDELDRLLRPGPVAPASVRSRRDPAANDSEGVPPPGRSGAKERPEAPRRPRITRLFRALFATRAVPTAPRAGARATA